MGSGDTPVVDLGARSYRGIIDFIHNSDGTLTAVNVIDLEEYLYGVVAAEIPSSYEYAPQEHTLFINGTGNLTSDMIYAIRPIARLIWDMTTRTRPQDRL